MTTIAELKRLARETVAAPKPRPEPKPARAAGATVVMPMAAEEMQTFAVSGMASETANAWRRSGYLPKRTPTFEAVFKVRAFSRGHAGIRAMSAAGRAGLMFTVETMEVVP